MTWFMIMLSVLSWLLALLIFLSLLAAPFALLSAFLVRRSGGHPTTSEAVIWFCSGVLNLIAAPAMIALLCAPFVR